jgi:[acyl-carrier-protein] S-malonyltransferase
MGKLAILFPGQGSQSPGMGQDLYSSYNQARTTFDTIDKLAGRSLSTLCFNGPEEELKRTVNTQPTILAVSLAAWACWQALEGPKADFVAGHSLGEFSALVAAGALSLEEAVRLVDKRSQLMESCPKGAMSAVLGLSAEALVDVCKVARVEAAATSAEANDCVAVVANFNTMDQLVISGTPAVIERAGFLAKERGGKVIPLPVGGAFHSPLMQGAANIFTAELATGNMQPAQIPVVQNFDARPAMEAADLKEKLSRQMAHSVRWCETIQFMLSQGVDTFVEIGPGKVLSGTVKKIDRAAKTYQVFDKASLEATLAGLKQAQAVG